VRQHGVLSVEEIEALLEQMKKHKRPATIDWCNQKIRVLSDRKAHATKKMKNGSPMLYSDVIFEL
jgi:hypothetical protein